MPAEPVSILSQLRRHAVALISLVVALTSLSYNTWRNEHTEENRNLRTAAFEILLRLGSLQEVVFFSHYDRDLSNRGNPRAGWAHVLTIQDLSALLPEPLPGTTGQLLTTWQVRWQGLGTDQHSADEILAEIDRSRKATVALLVALD
jgi:hypothetical protein